MKMYYEEVPDEYDSLRFYTFDETDALYKNINFSTIPNKTVSSSLPRPVKGRGSWGGKHPHPTLCSATNKTKTHVP
jgi:hypothetical protein